MNVIKSGGREDRRDIWHERERTVIGTAYWWEKLKERGGFEDLIVDGRILLKLI
jgi:hypothetical protein